MKKSKPQKSQKSQKFQNIQTRKKPVNFVIDRTTSVRRTVVKIPKNTKFTKTQKGLISEIKYRVTACNLMYGFFGLKLLKRIRFDLKQLELIRKRVVKHLGKTESLWFRLSPDFPVSKKPQEIRMGKGKGAVSHWIGRGQAGQILFEISRISEDRAMTLFFKIAKKLPIPCCLVKRNIFTKRIQEIKSVR